LSDSLCCATTLLNSLVHHTPPTPLSPLSLTTLFRSPHFALVVLALTHKSIGPDAAVTRLIELLEPKGGNASEKNQAPLNVADREIGKHTSELQSPDHLVCRLLLEKKKKLANTTVVYL